MSWKAELEKAMKGRPADEEDERDYDGEDGDEGDDDGDEEEEPRKFQKGEKCAKGTKSGKGKSGKYKPDPNGETGGDEDDEARVDDPDSIDKKTGGGSVKFASKSGTAKSLAANLSEEECEAIDASPVLSALVKGLEKVARTNGARIETLEEAVSEIGGSLQVIGKALAKSLAGQDTILKGIQSDVEQIGSEPRGRKSKIRQLDKSFAGNEGSKSELPTRQILLNKSLAAVQAGKLPALEVARLEAAYNAGNLDIVRNIWARVQGE